ncbi:MAG TPA: phosphate signaling complex protein PhoU [Anaerovoracaceae bacterium]|nr:phosphate signaling complex protein PhoU [Anaerovoracaceae bacterium]
MRSKFDEQLAALNVSLIKMGNLCENAINLAVATLTENNKRLIKEVNENEQEIDNIEREIEDLCLKLLLRQQPVAKDLRMISSALKMISDMERIGDQAADIAEISKYVKGTNIKDNTHIMNMGEATINMVRDSIKSFVEKDLALAYKVMEYDDVVDERFDQVKCEIVENIADNRDSAESGLDLLMIAKYFERIGDHAVNISEWVEFSITGNHSRSDEIEIFK